MHELYIKPEQRLHADKALPPPTPPPDPSLVDYGRCVEIHRTGNRLASRKSIEIFLREFPTSTKRDGIYDMLGELNAAEFFAAKPNEKNTYVVQSGDALARVAARTKVSVELLTYLNRITGKYLHPNQRLLAPPVAFRLVIQQKKQRLVLYNGDKFFRQYPAADWPGGPRAPLRPAQEGRVTEKRAFDGGVVIPPREFGYFRAHHVMIISIPGFSLHTQPTGQFPPQMRLIQMPDR